MAVQSPLYSKSIYCLYRQCPKAAWLKTHMPDKAEIDSFEASVLEAGTEVGKLARGLFPGGIDVTVEEGGEPDCRAMAIATSEALEQALAPAVYEASFISDGLYCAVDILVDNGDGTYDINEVKSTTKPSKNYGTYLDDVSFQMHVLEKHGIAVRKAYIVYIDDSYVRDGDIDACGMFSRTDVTDTARSRLSYVDDVTQAMKDFLASGDEPETCFSVGCRKPYDCPFWEHCSSEVPENSVFDLYRTSFSEKVALYNSGVRSFADVKAEADLKPIQARQVDHALRELPDHISPAGIASFVSYIGETPSFLDFETVMEAIPRYDGVRPYQQVPTQYSLHVENADGSLSHCEFLGEPDTDPRRELAESLVRDVPRRGTVLAYNCSFERKVIRELAEAFPDLSDGLLAIHGRIEDLMVPFTSGYYYNRAMGNSFSIKSVLPALFPGDPELDYHALEGVHNGTEAINAFIELGNLSGEDHERARRNLLSYCRLDTFAMVKIWWRLRGIADIRKAA